MAFVNDIHNADAGLIDRIAASIRTMRANRAERAEKDRLYRETLRELKSLSSRDLADIGIAASNIEAIAHEAAYGK